MIKSCSGIVNEERLVSLDSLECIEGSRGSGGMALAVGGCRWGRKRKKQTTLASGGCFVFVIHFFLFFLSFLVLVRLYNLLRERRLVSLIYLVFYHHHYEDLVPTMSGSTI